MPRRQHDEKDSLAMLPWFPRDWRASKARATMSPLARGIYRELLDAAWLEDGCSLPTDDDTLAALAGCSVKEWRKVKAEILPSLIEEGGRYRQRRLSWAWQDAANRRAKQRIAADETNAKRNAKRDGERNASEDGQRTPPTPSPSPTPSPTPTPTPISTEPPSGAGSGAGGTSPQTPARPPAGAPGHPGGPNGQGDPTVLDHDRDNPVEVRVARKVAHLARLVADRDGQQPTAQHALDVLASVSATPAGKSLDHVRNAPTGWLTVTVSGCDAFERDLFGATEAEDENQERQGGDDPPEEE